jgi:predicted transposase YbfD/YdcC
MEQEVELKETFLDFFSELEDPRIDRCKLYSVGEILLVTLTAVICGAEGWSDVERFGKSKVDFLKRYLPFENGIPSDDTYRRFFRRLDPELFRECFIRWVKNLSLPEETIIAIDGKVSRHSFDGDKAPLHMVSAFASESRIVLAQTKVADKSNEIKAIPDILEWLDLQSTIVTIDAMGCQREIAEQIISKGGDYVLALKGNQGSLHQDVQAIFHDKDLLQDLSAAKHSTTDGEHGRIETRRYTVLELPEILKKQHNWAGLKTIVEVCSRRELAGKPSEEDYRYYISSMSKDAVKLGHAIRSHWGIENSLHWILDISFRDDESRIRHGHAPENIAIVKHAALNLLQKNKKKRDTIKQLRKIAGWDDARLQQIIHQQL